MFDAGSPRGLAYSVVNSKWELVIKNLLPKLVALDLDFNKRQQAIKTSNLDDDSTLSWLVGYDDTGAYKNIILELITPHGTVAGNSKVPVSDSTDPIYGSVDPDRTHMQRHDITHAGVQTIAGLTYLLSLIDMLVDEAYDGISLDTAYVIDTV